MSDYNVTNEYMNMLSEEESTDARDYSMLEYVENERRTFDELPFSEVDSLVLTKLCYMHFTDVVPDVRLEGNAVSLQSLFMAERMEQYFDHVYSPQKSLQLFVACCSSPRFRNIRINYFSERMNKEDEKQFSATTFILPDGDIYIAFRGTDSSVVGWKEDFNMAFQRIVPSEISAEKYLSRVAKLEKGDIRIGGHSKGGTMALYSAAMCSGEIRCRIKAVYNHDGPGLPDEVLENSNYHLVKDKIYTTLPEDSLIGILFMDNDYQVVKSNRMGIMQHDPFSWIVSGRDFEYGKKLGRTSYKMNKSIIEMMKELTPEEREIAVDTIFKILESTGVDSFRDLPKSIVPEREKIKDAIKSIDSVTYSKVVSVLAEMLKIILKNMRTAAE